MRVPFPVIHHFLLLNHCNPDIVMAPDCQETFVLRKHLLQEKCFLETGKKLHLPRDQPQHPRNTTK